MVDYIELALFGLSESISEVFRLSIISVMDFIDFLQLHLRVDLYVILSSQVESLGLEQYGLSVLLRDHIGEVILARLKRSALVI